MRISGSIKDTSSSCVGRKLPRRRLLQFLWVWEHVSVQFLTKFYDKWQENRLRVQQFRHFHPCHDLRHIQQLFALRKALFYTTAAIKTIIGGLPLTYLQPKVPQGPRRILYASIIGSRYTSGIVCRLGNLKLTFCNTSAEQLVIKGSQRGHPLPADISTYSILQCSYSVTSHVSREAQSTCSHTHISQHVHSLHIPDTFPYIERHTSVTLYIL